MHSISFLQSEIETELNTISFTGSPENLYKPMQYMLSLGGKRMRPLLTLLGCELFNGDYKKALPAALGIELFHNFTLLHDDIMDNAPLRRNKQTVHTKWNNSIAILSGDAMFVKSCEQILKTDSSIVADVLKLFYKTATEVCEGQQLDMDFENKEVVSISEYTNMISLKTSVLLACSLQTGAMIAGANADACSHIYEFGKNIGIAFQIQDDLLDAYGDKEKFGKKEGGDILASKKTFLFAKTCELLRADGKTDFVNTYNSNQPNKVESVMLAFEKHNIKQHAQQAITNYHDEAISHLDKIALAAENKKVLVDFCEQLMVREI